MLRVQLTHHYPGFALDVSFAAPPGITALFGKSGSGKTTVVNAVAGLLRPESGRVEVQGSVLLDTLAGIHVPPRRRRIGYVFQDGRLFPHLSVRENLLYGRRFAPRTNRSAAPAGELDSIVAMLDIAPLLPRRPAGLSGGERARVAIGRALLSRPQLLILDEPLAALDEARRAEILPYLERLRDESQVPMLYISHAMAEVSRLATTLVLIEGGRVVAAGPLSDLSTDPAVAAHEGADAGAVLVGRIADHEPDGLTRIATAGGDLLVPLVATAIGQSVQLRVRAGDVIVSLDRPARTSALNVLPARMGAMQADGTSVLVRLDLAPRTALLARVTRRSAEALALRPGLACFATVKSIALG